MEYLENQGARDDIVKCSDGVFRWVYELPMIKSFFLLFEVWRVLLISGLLVALVMALVDLSNGTEFLEALEGAGVMLGIVFGILFVLSIPAYWIVVKANNGKYTVLFELDENFISHTQIKTEKARALELLTMMAGVAAGSPTTAGIGALNASGGSLTCRLEKVRRVRGNRKKHLIRVHTLLKRNMIYVKDSDYDFVMGYLREHCPNAKITP